LTPNNGGSTVFKYRFGIILGFGWGEVTNESYKRMTKKYVEEINELNKDIGHSDFPSYEGKIFRGKNATDKALKWVNPTIDSRGTIVFPSRGARQIAQQTLKKLIKHRDNRRIRVIILTGLIPDDEVVILSKSWVNGIGWRNLI